MGSLGSVVQKFCARNLPIRFSCGLLPLGRLHPLQTKVAEIAEAEFWIPARRQKITGSVVRSFDDFLANWAEVLLTPIIDQVRSRPIKDDFFVRYPDESKLKLTAPIAP